MELMSSLLLCALAALLPQTLGIKSNLLSEIKREPTKFIETPVPQKPVILNSIIPSALTLNTLLQSLLQDMKCSSCVDCLIKHLNSIKISKYSKSYMQSLETQNDVIDNYNQYDMIRNKRDVEKNMTENVKTKKVNKSENIKVTKYFTNEQIYALKIREKNSTSSESQVESCEVYKVKHHYPCESPKADLIFTTAKHRVMKRSKKQTKNTKTDEPQSTGPQPHFAGKVLAEPFMTSKEELYN